MTKGVLDALDKIEERHKPKPAKDEAKGEDTTKPADKTEKLDGS